MLWYCTADIPYDLDEIEIEQLRAAPASEVQGPNLLTGLVPGMSGGGVSGGGGMLLASTGKQRSGNTPRKGGGGVGRGDSDDASEGAINGSPGESSGGEVRL